MTMFRTLLKSKIHRVVVTNCELHYEGSCGIDVDLLQAADILPNEKVHIWNINNGERFETYAIPAPSGSGIISLNGSAARRASQGDLVIIATFGIYEDKDIESYRAKMVFVDAENKIIEERSKHKNVGF
jgi:aspartate 1-decarboxylase